MTDYSETLDEKYNQLYETSFREAPNLEELRKETDKLAEEAQKAKESGVYTGRTHIYDLLPLIKEDAPSLLHKALALDISKRRYLVSILDTLFSWQTEGGEAEDWGLDPTDFTESQEEAKAIKARKQEELKEEVFRRFEDKYLQDIWDRINGEA